MTQSIGAQVEFLLPCAAPAPFLESTLASLLAQTVKAWRLVIVLDGSDGELRALAKSMIPRDRLEIVSLDQRVGIARALNSGLKACVAEFTARIDADDVCEPRRLERQLAVMHAKPELALLGGPARLINAQGRVTGALTVKSGPRLRRELLKRNQFVHSSVMARTAALVQAGGYNPLCHLREDYDLWLRIAARHQVDNLHDEIVDYRLSGNQISRGSTDRVTNRFIWASRMALARTIDASVTRTALEHEAWRAAQFYPVQRVRRRLAGR